MSDNLHEDREYIMAAKKDPSAFELLYKKYHRKVYNYFWYRLNHHDELAEEMMQETFLKAFQSVSRFIIRDYSYQTYLLTIAHNILVNFFRRKDSVSLPNANKLPSFQTDTVDKKLELEDVWREVHVLPLHEKNAFLLRYRENLSIRDIAHIMEKSENAVKLLISRGRVHLKRIHLQDIVQFSDREKNYTQPKFLKHE